MKGLHVSQTVATLGTSLSIIGYAREVLCYGLLYLKLRKSVETLSASQLSPSSSFSSFLLHAPQT